MQTDDSRLWWLLWKVFTEWQELKGGFEFCMGETGIRMSEVNLKMTKILVVGQMHFWLESCVAAWKERYYIERKDVPRDWKDSQVVDLRSALGEKCACGWTLKALVCCFG